MKYGLSFLLCALAVAIVSSQSNTTDYILIARGIVEGISSVKGWSDITDCITNNEGIVSGFANAVATFKLNDSTTFTPAGIILGKALQKFPGALKTCTNSIQISQDLIETLSSFASWNDYVQIIKNNTILYNVDLIKQGYQATSEYTQGHLREFGNKVGQSLAQVFLNGTGKIPPKPDTNTTSHYILISQGVVEGVGLGLRWDEVKDCIQNNNKSYADIQNAIKFLNASDAGSVTQGLAAIGLGLQDIPAAIQDCTGAYGKAANLTKAIAALQNATVYFNIVGGNALINGVDIYDELYTAVQDFNVGAWKDFGTNVGQALAKLFLDNIDESRKSFEFLAIDI